MIRILFLNIALVLTVTAAKAQETLTLSQELCREMALAHDEDLQSADNAVTQAELDKKIAFSNYLPKLDGTAMGEYMTDMDMSGSTLRMRGMWVAGLSISQPLYVGGKINAGNKLAKIGLAAAKEKQRKTRAEVIADADNAYWSYISVQWKIRMMHYYMRQLDTLFAQINTSLDAGMVTRSDLLHVDSQRSQIEYQLQKVINGANLCRMSLCETVGVPLDTEICATDTIVVTFATDDDTYLDEDISLRPELALLNQQIAADKQQVRMNRADILPQLALSAGWTWYGNVKVLGTTTLDDGSEYHYSQKMNGNFGLAMLTLSVPLFHWGEGLRKVKKAKIDVMNAQLELDKNTRLMSIEARQAVQNVEDGRRMLETARVSCDLNDENLRIMTEQYTCGLSSLTDLLDSQSLWMESQSNLIEAQTQLKIYETEYLRVTGRL